MKRHLLFHLWPVRETGVWRLRVEQLKRRWAMFDGVKAVSVVTGPETVSACEVWDAIGDASVVFRELPNDSSLREMLSWDWLWSQVDDQNGAAFYCHGKGTRFPLNETIGVHGWTDMMFTAALDHWPLVERRLRQGAFAGSLRVCGGYPASHFHYAGTFYWARLDQVRGKFADVERTWWGVEPWPGRHFDWRHAGLLFQPTGVGIHDFYCWTPQIRQQWAQWQEIHRRLHRAFSSV